MWKDIIGWEKYYEINEHGDVRNKLTKHLVIGDKKTHARRKRLWQKLEKFSVFITFVREIVI